MRGTTTTHLGQLPFGLSALACLAMLGLGACQGAPAPLRPTATAFLGLKARVFPNSEEQVFEATRSALIDMGYVVREDGFERGFLHAHTIPAGVSLAGSIADPTKFGDGFTPQEASVEVAPNWTRITARIVFTDQHKRAPRTLLELEAERVTVTQEGPMEASSGNLGTAFYEQFFQDVEGRLPRPRLPRVNVLGLD